MSDTILRSEEAGTELTRFNALRHGILSRYTVLPWEDGPEYDALLSALVAEHNPEGPTEEHLVEELAGIFWRKRRLRLAEGAAHRRGLSKTFSPYRETAEAALAHIGEAGKGGEVLDAIRATQAATEQDFRDMQEDEAMTSRALEVLRSNRNDAYEAALAELREDTRNWWHELLDREPEELGENEERSSPDVVGLEQFLETEVLTWCERRRRELENRPLLREQAFGEALDPDKLERLGRYEVSLDRKLECILTMLIKLQEIC